MQKRPHLILRCKEHCDGIVEGWRRSGPDGPRRLRFEAGFHRWFKELHEPPADETRLCGPTPLATVAARTGGRRLHRAEIDLTGVRFPNPFIRGVRFSLATGLHVIAAHERRHLWQAWRVRQAAERSIAA
jgi:hypothetical protein